MGRSRKKTRSGRAVDAAATDGAGADTLVARVNAALEAGRFKDAVAAGKALLKGVSGGEEDAARALLARAYAGRAAQLADKGMFVEALAILGQRRGVCGVPPLAAEEVLWTLRAGRAERAAALLHEHAVALERSGELAALRERLAARLLIDGDELLEWLAPDDPLRRDHPAAETLLEAFCAADETGFETAAKRIPWRSPYRGFRQLLDAWHRHDDDPDAAAAAFGRIVRESPFGSLAARLVALLPRGDETLPETVSRLRALAPAELDAMATVRGWPAALVAPLRAACALGDAPDAKSRLKLLLAHADAFDADEARDAAHALLAHAPKSAREVSRRVGTPSVLESARQRALGTERRGDPDLADDAWEDVLDALAHPDGLPSALAGEETRRLARALVHRRRADMWSRPPLAMRAGAAALEELELARELDPTTCRRRCG